MSYYSKILNYLYDTFGLTLLCAGSIGSVLNCIIFGQKTMRKNPGSIYFLAFNLANLFVLYTILFITLLTNFFHIDPTIQSTIGCKIYYYFRTVASALSPYYLVLASMDRTFFTSSNALIRQRSTPRLAYRSIAGVTIIVLLYYTQTPVFADIYQLYPGLYLCYYKQGTYRNFSTFNSLVTNGFCPIILLGVFGILTMKNLYRTRIRPVTDVPPTTNTQQSKRNRQMAVMLLIEILIYMFSSLIFLNFNVYLQLTQSQTKNVQQQAFEQFLLAVLFLLTFIPQTTSFYVYLAVSKTFRQQTSKVLSKLCQHIRICNVQN